MPKSLNSQNCLKDTFYENTKGIEVGYPNVEESLNEHAKNKRMGRDRRAKINGH
jgi:hypothetical protein